MSNQSKDKITRIIKALLAKAAGTDNEAEASIFADKASEMMEQYQLGVLDVLSDDPVDMTVCFTGRADGPVRYKSRLCAAVGIYYGCRAVFTTKGKQLSVKLVGRESSRITADLMFPFILEQCRAGARKIAAETGDKVSTCERSVINAMIFRLDKLSSQHMPPEPVTVAGKNALIVLDAIKVKMDELYPDLTDARASSLSTTVAAKKAADTISINHQATGNTVKRLK